MEENHDTQNCADRIKKEYELRKQNNPNFSIRSFARWLEISPAQASQLISGKRKLTRKMALKIANRLNLSPTEKIDFLESTDEELNQHKKALHTSQSKLQLEEDQFALIADWPHYSILSLSETQEAKADPRWIAQRLSIDVNIARQCFDRLLRLKLIKVENKKFTTTQQGLTTSKDILSKAIQRHHIQNLDLAKHKLEQVPLEAREFSSITMAIDTHKIPKAKKLITEFKRNLCALLEEGKQTEVYTLSIQLFPNSKLKGEKNHE